MTKEEKKILCQNLGEKLPTFRTALNISQDDLASIVSISRQTLSAIENQQRVMTWTTFLALVLVFFRNEQTKNMLVSLSVYTPELNSYLTIQKQK